MQKWGEHDVHITVRVSNCGNWEYEALVAVHEIAEAVACVAAGIDPKTIDAFDTAHPMLDEPGDDFRAPYRSEHSLATGIERVLCSYLGISWQKYDDLLARLMGKRRAEETNSTTQTA